MPSHSGKIETFLKKRRSKKMSHSMENTSKIVALLLLQMLTQQIGLKVTPEMGGDYCFLVPSHWGHFLKSRASQHCWFQPYQKFTFSALCCLPSFFGDGRGLNARIASKRKGNSNFFESSRLQEINGTQGLLTLRGDATVSRASGHAHDWDHCEEITIPVDVLKNLDFTYLFFEKPDRHLACNMSITFILTAGIVTAGGYWAGAIEEKQQQFIKYNCYKPEDFEHTAIISGIFFICKNIATLSFILLMLYCSYDHLVCLITGLFCTYTPVGLYSCLSPSLNKLPFGEQKVHLQCLYKGLKLLLAGFSIFTAVFWMVFRNEEQWVWILQNALGISICLYELKEVHIANMKNRSLLLLVLLVYSVFLVLITPSLTRCGDSIIEIVTLEPFDSAQHKKIPFMLKIPVW
ncbi:LOW QUALITY PROTEIN: signal peptide peptidase-like 2B [Pluvialis apricaria]